MNWTDYLKHRFVYGGMFYNLSLHHKRKLCLRREIMFMLNIHREGWVPIDDILSFIYDGVDLDEWGEYQLSIMRTTIWAIRKLLPCGVRILNNQNGCYMLAVS